MKYFLLQNDVEHYYWVEETKDRIIDLSLEPGNSCKNHYDNLKLRLFFEDDEKSQLKGIGDIPNFQNRLNLLIISEKAYNILKPYIEKNIEIINVKIEKVKMKYYCINVLKIENCLDLEKSNFEWLEENESILDYDKYVFNETKIASDFFRLKYDEHNIFISGKLKDIIEKSDLEGFLFYDIENGSPKIF